MVLLCKLLAKLKIIKQLLTLIKSFKGQMVSWLLEETLEWKFPFRKLLSCRNLLLNAQLMRVDLLLQLLKCYNLCKLSLDQLELKFLTSQMQFMI